MEHFKTLRDSTVSKLVTKNGLKLVINQPVNIPLKRLKGLKLQC